MKLTSIRNYNNQSYVIDTCHVIYAGIETAIFKFYKHFDDEDIVDMDSISSYVNWLEVFTHRSLTTEGGEQIHNDILDDIGKFIGIRVQYLR